MRKRTLRLALITIASMLMFGPNIFHSRLAASAQRSINPACVEFCRQKMYDCILEALQNGENDQRCISAYRSCIPHCQ